MEEKSPGRRAALWELGPFLSPGVGIAFPCPRLQKQSLGGGWKFKESKGGPHQLSFHPVVQITNRHILKVMLTFLSRDLLPKTTQAQLVLAPAQNQGLSSETKNIYTAGRRSGSFAPAALRPGLAGNSKGSSVLRISSQATSRTGQPGEVGGLSRETPSQIIQGEAPGTRETAPSSARDI